MQVPNANQQPSVLFDALARYPHRTRLLIRAPINAGYRCGLLYAIATRDSTCRPRVQAFEEQLGLGKPLVDGGRRQHGKKKSRNF